MGWTVLLAVPRACIVVAQAFVLCALHQSLAGSFAAWQARHLLCKWRAVKLCRSGPRFDPGFGEETEAQQSIYIRPTYSSEVGIVLADACENRHAGCGSVTGAAYGRLLV